MDIQHQDNKIKSKKLSNKDDNRNLGVLKPRWFSVWSQFLTSFLLKVKNLICLSSFLARQYNHVFDGCMYKSQENLIYSDFVLYLNSEWFLYTWCNIDFVAL